jgi:acetyl-CoA C-acetyltransferase
MVHDGLWDIVNDFHMGISNELCSERYGIDREEQDRYAAESYRRTLAAIESGIQRRNHAGGNPSAQGRSGHLRHGRVRPETSYDALAKMRPAFQKGGVTTAGNASIISDGAAAVVVMAREKAEALGCP